MYAKHSPSAFYTLYSVKFTLIIQTLCPNHKAPFFIPEAPFLDLNLSITEFNVEYNVGLRYFMVM